MVRRRLLGGWRFGWPAPGAFFASFLREEWVSPTGTVIRLPYCYWFRAETSACVVWCGRHVWSWGRN